MILLLALLSTLSARPITHKDVVLAIDCGQTAPKTHFNISYKADQHYSKSSRVVTYPIDEKEVHFLYTREQHIYYTERHADDVIAYALPLKKPGLYTLILKFMEMHFTEPGQRMFDIQIGKKFVALNIDIINETQSRYAALEKYYEIELTEEYEFFFEDELCEEAYEEGKFELRIVRGKADLPKIDAIVVVRGGSEEGFESEYVRLRERWEEYLEEEAEVRRKQEELESLEYWVGSV